VVDAFVVVAVVEFSQGAPEAHVAEPISFVAVYAVPMWATKQARAMENGSVIQQTVDGGGEDANCAP
jgi:hypothetical protein